MAATSIEQGADGRAPLTGSTRPLRYPSPPTPTRSRPTRRDRGRRRGRRRRGRRGRRDRRRGGRRRRAGGRRGRGGRGGRGGPGRAELRAALSRAPGEWYVVHSYAGYENKVKTNLETRIQTLDAEDFIFQVEVPTEEVTEIKNGQRKQVQRKVLPGYILVRMDLNDTSWGVVRNTPGGHRFRRGDREAVAADTRRRGEVPAAAGPSSPSSRLQPGRRERPPPASHCGDRLRGRRVGYRDGRAVRHAARRRSARSTSTSRSSRCWCPSSAGRPRSSWRSARYQRSDPQRYRDAVSRNTKDEPHNASQKKEADRGHQAADRGRPGDPSAAGGPGAGPARRQHHGVLQGLQRGDRIATGQRRSGRDLGVTRTARSTSP